MKLRSSVWYGWAFASAFATMIASAWGQNTGRDLRGIWQASNTVDANLESGNTIVDPPGGKIPYRPSALAMRNQNFANRATADPETKCFQPGVPRANYLSSPFQIFQNDGGVYVVYQDVHAYRIIYMDGSPHNEGLPYAMGDSRGHWEGNTLVADVTSFSAATWLDGAGNYHSDALHVVERYTRRDRDTLIYEATIEDQKVFDRPWKIRVPLRLQTAPGVQIFEDECAEDESGVRHHVSPFKDAVTQQLPPGAPPADKPMTVEKVKDGLYLIRGPFSVCGPQGCRGATPQALSDGLMHEAGDVAVRVTPDGVILVDDKFPWNVPELLEKVKSITPQPIKYVLNSHYHPDHSGANAAMLEHGFEVITQRTLRDEILGKGGTLRNEPAAAPRIVFGDFGALYLGGVEVQMLYLGRAHTSGDTFVYFPDLKAVHTGDVLMDGAPFIDYLGGGSAVEWVKTLYNLLKLDFDTVIPGHGPVFTKQYVREYVQKFETMNQRMTDLVKEGVPKDRDRLVAGLKLDDLGWAHTDSTDTFIERSIEGYYDEMAAILAAQSERPGGK